MSWRSALSRNVQEIRLHLCQTSASSEGVRKFISNNYKDLKALNPRLPILIRECKGVEPRLFARYGQGVEKSASLSNLSESAVTAELERLAKAGEPLPR